MIVRQGVLEGNVGGFIQPIGHRQLGWPGIGKAVEPVAQLHQSALPRIVMQERADGRRRNPQLPLNLQRAEQRDAAPAERLAEFNPIHFFNHIVKNIY